MRRLGAFLLLLVLPAVAASQNPSEFKDRRDRVKEAMDQGVAVVFSGHFYADPAEMVQEREDSDFYYLTGAEALDAVMLLNPQRHPRGRGASEILFLMPESPAFERRMGPQLHPTPETASRLRFERVLPTTEFKKTLEGVLEASPVLYTILGPGAPNRPEFETLSLIKELRFEYPQLEVRDLGDIVGPMRHIKSPAELEIMRRAARITADAVAEAMRAARPGMYEYEIQAHLEFHMKRKGARGYKWVNTVGSGPNALVLHYYKNDRKTQDGDLVLMDVGIDYEHYMTDFTRTFPVSGKFTPRQRELYDLVVEAHRAALAATKPGVTLQDVHQAALAVFEREGLGEHFWHSVSHWEGLDHHDPGAFNAPLRPGMAFSLEPALYIPEEGIGIRIEDMVILTEKGPEVLSVGAPIEADEIEALMARGRGGGGPE